MDNKEMERLRRELQELSAEEKEKLLEYIISLKSRNETELARSLN